MKRKNVFKEAGMVQTGRRIKGFSSVVSWKIFERSVTDDALFVDTEKELLPVTFSHVGLQMRPDDLTKMPRNKTLKLFVKE
jgi:hypothetical protein